MSEYDVVIIGGGPAGLTAGLYAARDKLKSLLIEKALPGGLITYAERVENFPGFPEGISGIELGELMEKQAQKYGLETVTAEATGVRLDDQQKIITATSGEFTARALIIASGSERQKLGIPGEAELVGKGVSYCATCDGAFFTDRPVAVVGGGDAALTEALHLAKIAAQVTVIHRRDALRATRILQERAADEPKIEIRWNTVVEAIEGEPLVSRLQLRDVKSGEKSSLEVAGVFISIGFTPNTGFAGSLLALDKTGQIVTNQTMETSVSGIFAAGDVRTGSGRQAVTAAGDGATAAIYAEKYLSG